MSGVVTAVSRSATHTMTKPAQTSIRLLEALGVEGDAHAGTTVKHRSRVARDPSTPNLRQVHLIHAELHDELRTAGLDLAAGQMGENVTTRGIDLLALPTGTRLHLGDTGDRRGHGASQSVRVSWMASSPGLMAATLGHDERGGADSQGRRHGDRVRRRRGAPGRCDPRRAPARAASRAPTGLAARFRAAEDRLGFLVDPAPQPPHGEAGCPQRHEDERARFRGGDYDFALWRGEVADRQHTRSEDTIVAIDAVSEDVARDDGNRRLITRAVGTTVRREGAVEKKPAEVENGVSRRLEVLVVPDVTEGPEAACRCGDREVRVRATRPVVCARDLDRGGRSRGVKEPSPGPVEKVQLAGAYAR